MFELLRSNSLRQLLARHLPALGISLVIAEIFYKLGSFTLECLAFLATWLVVDGIFALIQGRVSPTAGQDLPRES